MRHTNGLLFLGGPEAETKRAVRRLKRLLKEAITMSSGLQQGINRRSTEYKEGEQEIKDTVSDIAAALLGRRITFGKKLPYPPTKYLYDKN